jgi:coenzyme F420-reducing hydrogenase beta subunit
VLVVGINDERPVASLTDDIEEVKKAAGSKYGPVPVLAVLIPELMRKPRRIAGTFTPCQLGGWHEATKHIPRLKESGVISVGLFCGYVQSYDALSSAAASIGLEYPGGARLTHWRYGSYPGGLRFERPDGSEALKPLYSYYDLVIPHFSLYRCFLCPDSGNWLSDITLGDIHTEGERENVIVCRTARGRDLLESARNAGRITTRLMTPGQIENSTLRNIERSKMLPALECIDWLRKNGMMIPAGFDYFDLPPRKISGMLRSVWLWKLRMIFWFRRGRQRRFLLKHPSIMEWTGHFLYNLPGSIPGWKLMIRVRSLFRS